MSASLWISFVAANAEVTERRNIKKAKKKTGCIPQGGASVAERGGVGAAELRVGLRAEFPGIARV